MIRGPSDPHIRDAIPSVLDEKGDVPDVRRIGQMQQIHQADGFEGPRPLDAKPAPEPEPSFAQKAWRFASQKALPTLAGLGGGAALAAYLISTGGLGVLVPILAGLATAGVGGKILNVLMRAINNRLLGPTRVAPQQQQQAADVAQAATHLPEWNPIKITNYLEGARVHASHDETMRVNSNATYAQTLARLFHGTKDPEKSKLFNMILGKRTLDSKAGRCFAAAAGVVHSLVMDPNFRGTIELAGSNAVNHAFVVVNRANYDPNKPDKGINDVANWGPNAFVIDVWQANQKTGEMEDTIITDTKNWDYGKLGNMVSSQIWTPQTRAQDRRDAQYWNSQPVQEYAQRVGDLYRGLSLRLKENQNPPPWFKGKDFPKNIKDFETALKAACPADRTNPNTAWLIKNAPELADALFALRKDKVS